MVYTQFVAAPPVCSLNLCGSQFNPGYPPALIGLAVILLVDGLIGIWGTWVAYPAGALLSAVLLFAMGYSAWIQSSYSYLVEQYYQDLIGVALAAIGLLVNLVAWRAKYALSEQANPMNLPVFG
ncbi:MAG TPA: hypothetical protein VIW22_02990 [Nitrososphaerales archaeon]